jgi:hypothetical protein
MADPEYYKIAENEVEEGEGARGSKQGGGGRRRNGYQ